ncbi:hypothetical protein D0T50_05675 [Bacteroides sp. 214]|uniref:hypothetical protein n=1 Tax=Bacteroides sp. 214 TaxID=2302935 RepID=UPI0013D034E7|nr:hypothetical protein [Bacteroides sp. 214]NDW12378.1 hypothetical protein [Bacteroides sp. 214]
MGIFIISLVIIFIVKYFLSFNKYKKNNGLLTQADAYESVKWDEFARKCSSRLNSADKNGTFMAELATLRFEARVNRDKINNQAVKLKANKLIENLDKEYAKRTNIHL